MLVGGWTIACWILGAALASARDEGTASGSTPPVCPVQGWKEAQAEIFKHPVCIETRWVRVTLSDCESPTISDHPQPVNETVGAAPTGSTTGDDAAAASGDQELDTESPLDNVNFLSFEDWKKQNLAKVGQSAEDLGQKRAAGAAGKEDRQRPTGIHNALDSLGDDAEIELDFAGFGANSPDAASPASSWSAGVAVEGRKGADATAQSGEEDVAVPRPGQEAPAAGMAHSKDAGTTCKERFNYASFDCAATVLKTNPECTGSSSVLIENKDSYMLNECRATNKFLILELCDDILVDTVVLANYEFFSSIFHTFRVSVADRYPAKPDQWKELGIYQARNTREVQAFAVENPLIWARYLKIEFLTHYGHEFYCPLSLIRVHGTTMLEEYKHDGDAGRVEEEIAHETLQPHPEGGNLDALETPPPPPAAVGDTETQAGPLPATCPRPRTEASTHLLQEPTCGVNEASTTEPAESAKAAAQSPPSPSHPPNETAGPSADAVASVDPRADTGKEATEPKATEQNGAQTAPSAPPSSTPTIPVSPAQKNATTDTDTRVTHPPPKDEAGGHGGQGGNAGPAEGPRSTTTQPPAANPTTQESFFKSVNKRLQMLESNSTLSLLYIEEQSRILRDAFNKVEKRQLGKTSTFLENLNGTVLGELKQFREQYDQVWHSVALEFEHQRIQYHQEVSAINGQLGVLADELVFQKRVTVIQSLLVLLCFALVLFSRGNVGSYMDFPRMQNMMSRSYSFRSGSPPLFGSPSGSPSSTRPTSSYRNPASGGDDEEDDDDDSQDEGVPTTAGVYSPPTPTSDPSTDDEAGTKSAVVADGLAPPDVTPPHLRSRSSPPVMNGGPLTDRSTNTHLANNADHEKAQDLKNAPATINSMDYHRQVLQGKLEGDDKNQASYVSPSDDIMSPCSKKLSDLKGKRFKKSPSPSSATGPRRPSTWYVEQFVEKDCIPAEPTFQAQLGQGEKRWKTNPVVLENLKAKARSLGLWNMFLPKNHFSQGAGFSNLEYGLMAEYLGKSKLASEATNNAAPDTGNMEVLAKYGNEAQKRQWLAPLLEGKIRSAFLMTEPEVASSDATNIQLDIRREGNEYVLNGSSVILVEANTPGVTVHRMLTVYGYDDAPHGHGHISFKDVRVPVANMVLGEGRGFEIIQGRLGPGRIHHAMRTIGAAEKALEWMIARINDDRKQTFGKPLAAHGVILEWIARSRIEIDAARLIVLNAAAKIDAGDAKSALKEIAQAKVLVPQTALTVIDRAVQAYGAAGVCQDTPLANLWAMIRTLRIADGPDEVHLQQLGKRENRARKDAVMEKLNWQRAEGERQLAAAGYPKSHL
ncbi:hypothetical protein P168DRAFT_295902 [Aspergillus campestris IBT 28561]|uniref:SUN domain-containing protein n=1 Tax=Aspergillus campestris (strain IBT 28561) TaxID=1392248 RepID=A0A2I1D6D8_ASPC2|nr:uncharacterized protein P168DRAFT_295902 [Aspergillus campestris IBT 28561]PKY05444.1 hypothetical protein P168DRAFT_295902 [Aspergillus campestris IBT 28561]